ncbi:MAG: hypothetical protein IPK15_26515, partial [Verrucomicrobia bacterium]|nr:hypothetical protein [Verrucomicrobiota bacterium]
MTLATGSSYSVGLENVATVTIADDDNQSPTVTLTAPAEGTIYPLTPTNIVITATAADPDGSVEKVEFFWQGTNKIGEAFSAPYSIEWFAVGSGSNALTAVATDNLAGTSVSAPMFIVLNAAPTVAITSPATGSSFRVGTNITLTATATDPDGAVAEVSFYNGGILLGTDSMAPYSLTLSNVAAGSYLFVAVATDNRGLAGVSEIAAVSVNSGIVQFTDNFAARNTITGLPVTVVGSSSTATAEVGEPDPLTLRNDRTLWIAWTAPFSGEVAVDTFTSGFDTVLAVYRGTVLSTLTSMGANDDTQSL